MMAEVIKFEAVETPNQLRTWYAQNFDADMGAEDFERNLETLVIRVYGFDIVVEEINAYLEAGFSSDAAWECACADLAKRGEWAACEETDNALVRFDGNILCGWNLGR